MAMRKSPSASGGKCPICGRPGALRYKPFCSRRCADVDLSRWLRGGYTISAEADDEDGAAATPAGEGESGPDRDPR